MVTNYIYNAANQLYQDDTYTYEYDNNGNLVKKKVTVGGATVDGYTWDRANRLLSMGGASYQYDGEGRRVQQTVGATITKYLLDIQPSLAVVLSETTGANTMRYVHSPRGIHAHKDTGGNWEWMVQDGLGSVREVVDNLVGVLESRNYDPYGNPFGATGTSQTGFGFTGELVDGGGLLDLRARQYNAGIGVFASLDPLETRNRYAYVSGNPINQRDPSGLVGGTTTEEDEILILPDGFAGFGEPVEVRENINTEIREGQTSYAPTQYPVFDAPVPMELVHPFVSTSSLDEFARIVPEGTDGISVVLQPEGVRANVAIPKGNGLLLELYLKGLNAQLYLPNTLLLEGAYLSSIDPQYIYPNPISVTMGAKAQVQASGQSMGDANTSGLAVTETCRINDSDKQKFTLYRSVGPTELQSVRDASFLNYGISPNGGKYFAKTESGVWRFANADAKQRGKVVTVTKVDVPESTIAAGDSIFLGGPFDAGDSLFYTDDKLLTVMYPSIVRIGSRIVIIGAALP